MKATVVYEDGAHEVVDLEAMIMERAITIFR